MLCTIEENIVEKLIAGFRRFQQLWFYSKQAPFLELKEGQNPRVLIIACSDSRVDPAILTDANPGDVFVIRNIANLVPPYTTEDGSYHGVSAAIEYAVIHLQVEAIIVMGHARCGGIQNLLTQGHTGDSFIDRWMSIAQQAKVTVEYTLPKASLDIKQKVCEQLSIQISLNNMLTFPWIKSAVEDDKLKLYGWYFDITTGELMQFDKESNSFARLVPPYTSE